MTMPKANHVGSCAVFLFATSAALLLLVAPSSAQDALSCVTSKCVAQLGACQASATCFPGLLCGNNCLSSATPEAYVACVSKCIYTYLYGDAASAALNRCILANKCAKPKFALPSCPAVKKSPLSILKLRGKYTVVLRGSVANTDAAQYTFKGSTIVTLVRPSYLKPAKIIKIVSKRTSGATYKAAIAGLSLVNKFSILAISPGRKFVVLGYCGVDTGAISVLVLSSSGALPSTAVARKLAAGLAASGWGSKYPYKKLVKVPSW